MTLGCTRTCWPVGRKKGREGVFVGDLRLDNACDDLPVRPWWKSVSSGGGCCCDAELVGPYSVKYVEGL